MGEPAKTTLVFLAVNRGRYYHAPEGVSTRLSARLLSSQPVSAPAAEPISRLTHRAAPSAHRLAVQSGSARRTEPQRSTTVHSCTTGRTVRGRDRGRRERERRRSGGQKRQSGSPVRERHPRTDGVCGRQRPVDQVELLDVKPGEKLVERVDPGFNDPSRPSRAREQLRRDGRGQVPGSDGDDEQRSGSRSSMSAAQAFST